MRQTIDNEKYGKIVYEENGWSGKKSLSINGKVLTKTSRTTFKTEDEKTVSIVGNYLSGSKLVIDSDSIVLTEKLKWYEIVLSVLPFILVLIWGSSAALVKIIPIVGGAIGGVISAMFAMLNMFLIKNVKNIWLKIIISLATLVVTFLVCYLIALGILGTI